MTKKVTALTLYETYSRECLAIYVDKSIMGEGVAGVLDAVLRARDKPERIKWTMGRSSSQEPWTLRRIQWGKVRLLQIWKANGQHPHRIFHRQSSGRVLECQLVYVSGRCQKED